MWGVGVMWYRGSALFQSTATRKKAGLQDKPKRVFDKALITARFAWDAENAKADFFVVFRWVRMENNKLAKNRKRPFLLFPWTRESRKMNHLWTPAFAGVTASEAFYEIIKVYRKIFLQSTNILTVDHGPAGLSLIQFSRTTPVLWDIRLINAWTKPRDMIFKFCSGIFNSMRLLCFLNPKSKIYNPKSCLNTVFVQIWLHRPYFLWLNVAWSLLSYLSKL